MLVIYSGAASITREIRHMLRLVIVLSRDSLVSISCGLVPFPKRRLQARSCQVEFINHMAGFPKEIQRRNFGTGEHTMNSRTLLANTLLLSLSFYLSASVPTGQHEAGGHDAKRLEQDISSLE